MARGSRRRAAKGAAHTVALDELRAKKKLLIILENKGVKGKRLGTVRQEIAELEDQLRQLA